MLKTRSPRHLSFALLLSAVLAACRGGGGGGGGSPPPAPLSISPSSVTLDVSAAQVFTAAGGRPAYQFSLLSGLGSIGAVDGRYVAPPTATTAVVRVTDAAGAKAQATVTVLAPLLINPAAVTVGAGTTSSFSASGGKTPYVFSVVSGDGTITSGGVYTAPSTPGPVLIRVTDARNKTADASITVNRVLAVDPPAITMTVGSGSRYSFAGLDGVPPYSYELIGSGSLDASGTYTAGTSGGSASVRVRDAQGSTVDAAIHLITLRVNAPVRAAVNDGTSWYIGGDFDALFPSIAEGAIMVNAANGDPILSCDLAEGFDGTVRAVTRSATALYVGGDFTHYRGQPAQHLAKLDAYTCALDTTFTQATGMDQPVVSVALLANSIYVVGNFSIYRGTPAQSIAKLDALTGTLDTTFTRGSGMGSPMLSVVALGQSVYIGGSFTAYRGRAAAFLAKVDATTGVLDSTFMQNGGVAGNVASLATDGTSLYVVGQILAYGSHPAGNLIKIDAITGILDTTFSQAVDFDQAPLALAVSGTSLYVGGPFYSYRGAPVNNLVKLDTINGNLDSGFAQGAGLNGVVFSLAATPTDVYVGGAFSAYDGKPAHQLAKLNAATGTLDQTFTQAAGFDQDTYLPTRGVRALALQGGSLAVGGDIHSYRGIPAGHVAKFDMTTGAGDSTFNGGGGADSRVETLKLAGGSLYVGGAFATWRHQPYPALVKVDPVSGAVDTQFNSTTGFDSGSTVYAVAPSGANLYVGGSFTTYNGTLSLFVAKLNATNGARDTGFQPVFGFSDVVKAIQPIGTSVFLGGHFFPSIAKVDATTGTADPSFAGRDTNFWVETFAASGSDLYVGGNFSSYSGVPASGMVRIAAADGTPDPAFLSTFTGFGFVRSIALSGTSVYAGGIFSAYQSLPANSVARIDVTSGSLDTNFASAKGPDQGVRAVVPTPTAVWIGGDFRLYRDKPAYYFVPLDPITGENTDP